MKYKMVLVSLSLAFLLSASTHFTFAQDTVTEVTANEPETQWLWGEVASVDAANNALTIKYLDYETDTEKEMVMSVDTKTTFENTNALVEIRPLDTISVDYVTTADGKNTARNVSLEKPEPEEAAPQAEAPEEMGSSVAAPVPAAEENPAQ